MTSVLFTMGSTQHPF